MQRFLFAFVFAAIVAALGTTGAFARPVVNLKLSASIVEKDDNGAQKLVPLSSDAGLKPGQEVRYTIVASNAGTDAATNLVPQAKIPAGTAYEAGSASVSDAAKIEFSLDGGKTWSVKPTVRVQTAAGAVEKAASPASFTMLRWVGSKALSPQATLSYSYQVRVK